MFQCFLTKIGENDNSFKSLSKKKLTVCKYPYLHQLLQIYNPVYQ